MNRRRPTALIADDEPLLRDELAALLADAWPELEVVAHARNGREAVERHAELRPDICFLDVQMPGVSGIEAARQIGPGAHLVFVTAFDQYALSAFDHGVLDYLVKPVEPRRLAQTVARLRERVQGTLPALATEALLAQLADDLKRRDADAVPPLRWIRATVGHALRLIPVEDVDFISADDKYTVIAWRDDDGKAAEALIATPLKQLLPQLDPLQFAQVHRSHVVNWSAVSHVTRAPNETAQVHIKGRKDVLPVSRSYLHLFKQM
ncbi:LytR/AlgR family response regulator transcription factor [Scleromatobacter humisilvae]|uniref:LytTR family DNA-binding domain-containing protein n=1 Tax=Scleromatobacter humisilvae TaxID=2897159 RepID=A0A9X1YL48_9BURK|nr:LytTR family DNA-binding domain-containing protein [Scleromatobacter humisilvae]MCK9686743.1 LytTR family DNA-binding domain-containing protein [Scleromatobacter humisilvae]